MLEVENLTTGYGRLGVLDGLSLSIPERSVVGLIGANGAGKTTTVSAIAGILPAWKGAIRFLGKPVAGLRPDQICQRGISLVPQSRELFPMMTAYENLEVAALARHGRTGIRDRIDRVLANFPKLQSRLRSHASSVPSRRPSTSTAPSQAVTATCSSRPPPCASASRASSPLRDERRFVR